MESSSNKFFKLILVFLIMDFVLGLVVVAKCILRKGVIVVPYLDGQLVIDESPQDKQLINFAHMMLINLENFTPNTIEQQDNFITSKVSPGFINSIKATLDQRKSLVKESGMSSQLLCDMQSALIKKTKDHFWQVSMDCLKRVFISDRFSFEQKSSYAVAVEGAPPTKSNPYGLSIAGVFEKAQDNVEDQKNN